MDPRAERAFFHYCIAPLILMPQLPPTLSHAGQLVLAKGELGTNLHLGLGSRVEDQIATRLLQVLSIEFLHFDAYLFHLWRDTTALWRMQPSVISGDLASSLTMCHSASPRNENKLSPYLTNRVDA